MNDKEGFWKKMFLVLWYIVTKLTKLKIEVLYDEKFDERGMTFFKKKNAFRHYKRKCQQFWFLESNRTAYVLKV